MFRFATNIKRLSRLLLHAIRQLKRMNACFECRVSAALFEMPAVELREGIKLTALCVVRQRRQLVMGLAWLSLASGRLRVTEITIDESKLAARLRQEMERIAPAEILADQAESLINDFNSRSEHDLTELARTELAKCPDASAIFLMSPGERE